MVPRAHFGPIPIGRVEISIDEPQFRWMREHGTLHIPDVRAQNDFPMLGLPALAHFLSRSPSSARGTYWDTGRTSHRGASLHAGADQTPGNFRRPSGDRDRECAAVPGTQGVIGAADGDERDLGVIASSPTDIQPVLDTIARAQRVYASHKMLRFIVLRTIWLDKWQVMALTSLFSPSGETRPSNVEHG